MKTNIKRIDTLIALYNKSLATATHERLMYLWSALTVYAKEETIALKWTIMIVPCKVKRVTGKIQVFEV